MLVGVGLHLDGELGWWLYHRVGEADGPFAGAGS